VGPGDPEVEVANPTPTRTAPDPRLTDDTRPAVVVDAIRAPVSAVRIVQGRSVSLPIVAYSTFPADSEVLVWRVSNSHLAIHPHQPVMRGRLDGTFRAALNGPAIVRIRGTSLGAATLTVVAPGGAKLSVKVHVVRHSVGVQSLTITHKRLRMAPGQIADLTAVPSPKGATGAIVRWTSSRPKVAIVDDAGRLFARARGRSVITAQAGSSKAKFTLTVR
jgi:hypothetical protein